MNQKLSISKILFSAALLAGVLLFTVGCVNSIENNYWKLGVGNYGSNYGGTYSNLTFWDNARMDWLMVCFGNEPATIQTAERLNQYLAVNPKQKYLIRLWPGYSKRRPGEQKARPVTFLDYLYEPGTKEKILRNIDQQVLVILDNIKQKDAVYGFTFQEELPFHFSQRECDLIKPDKLPPDLIRYRSHYEKETGKRLEKWDLESRTWWAKNFAKALNEINSHIKKTSGNRKVFVWFAAHCRPLDWLEKGENPHSWRVFPIYWKDLIKPGVADGFFAYSNNPYWAKKYSDLAKKNKWIYFSQLSQQSGMRLGSWKECIEIAENKNPYNLGYFLYIEGNDKHNVWNDDPSIPDDDNIQRYSIVTHLRRYCAQKKINMELIRNVLKPTIQLDHALGNLAVGRFDMVTAVITNQKDHTWYLSEEDSANKNLKVRLTLPDEFEIPLSNSAPAEVEIESLPGGRYTQVTWWVRRKKESPVPGKIPVKLTLSGADSSAIVVKSEKPVCRIRPQETFQISSSGEKFLYINFGAEKWSRNRVTMEFKCISGVCTRPAIQVGTNKWIYNGELKRGESLTVTPDHKILFRDSKGKTRDVSENHQGTPVLLSLGVNQLIYTDENPKTGGIKLKLSIKIEKIKKEKKK